MFLCKADKVLKEIEEKLEKADIEIAAPALTVKWVPDESEIKKCFEFGKKIAKKVKKS